MQYLSKDEVRGIIHELLTRKLVGRILISDRENVRHFEAEALMKAKLSELTARGLIRSWSAAEAWSAWVHNQGMTLEFNFDLDEGLPY